LDYGYPLYLLSNIWELAFTWEKTISFIFEKEGNLGWTFVRPWAQKATIGLKKVMINNKKHYIFFSFLGNIFKIKVCGCKVCQPMSEKVVFGRILSYINFYFYDLFYDPWLSYLLKWKESDEEKYMKNKLTLK
jgi:hypothetical protein